MMEVMAFRTLYDAGQAKLGSTPPAMTGPPWIISMLPFMYRAFNFGPSTFRGTYGAFNFGPSSLAGTYGSFPALPARIAPAIIQ